MACVALTCLMSTMELEFLQPIPRVSLPEDAPIKSFFDNLSSFQDFLQKESSGKVRDLEIEIREFALKAEDAIEIQLTNFLLAKDTECEEDKASQQLHQTLREASEKAAELLVNILNSNEVDDDDEVNESVQDFESPKLLDNRMVGRDHDCETIKNHLIDRYDDYYCSELKLVWIVGMPGIGKTLLAKCVYEDPIMKPYFEVQVWITLPRKYNLREILCNLLLSIAAPTEQPTEVIKRISRPCELADQVRKCLNGRRFLIVLDNFWNNRAWDDIKQCFPDNENESRILLTTTYFERDSYASSSYYIYIHNMTLLNSTSSWDLFCNIVRSLNKDPMAPIFEKIRSCEIVGKCDGLPKLIVAVAKRLSTCNNIQQEGKRIEKELDSIGILDRPALTFVFNQLPLHLKVCFLYLGVFPKRSEILVKMLVRLWYAEGFVKSECEAYSYLQQLIDRSLVLIGRRSSFDNKSKTCRIHSAWHSFCIGESQKEGIFCAVNTRQHLGLSGNAFANSCRWLSFYTHSFDYYVLFSTNYSRSVFFFDDNHEMFAPSNLLRVLAFVSSPFFQRVPKHLGNLVFLRYLSVTQWFEGLGDIVSANPNLQTLVISHSESQLGTPTLIHLPSTIWEPPHLRHLELGNMYTVDPPSVVKVNLETLSWQSPTHCRKEVFSRFPHIKKLKFVGRDDLEPGHTSGSCSNAIILDNIDCMKELEVLTISVSVGWSVTLSELSLPLELRKLRLSGTNLSEGNLAVISQLPNLQSLKLENAFHGNVWEIAEGGFRELRFLLLEAEKLEQMMASVKSFRRLDRLVLRSCYCLKEIPLHFAKILSLDSVELDKCSLSAVQSAKMIQKKKIRYWGYGTLKVTILPPEESKYTHSYDSEEDEYLLEVANRTARWY